MKQNFGYGSGKQFEAMLQNKISQIKGVNAATNTADIPASYVELENITADDDSGNLDNYLTELAQQVKDEVLDNGLEDITFDTSDNDNIIIYVTDSAFGVDEYTVPLSDLTLDISKLSEDVAYIVNTILYNYDGDKDDYGW